MPRSEYNDFVAQYARQHRPAEGWKKGQLLREASAAWRAAGHIPKGKNKSSSECAGKKQTDCLPPCSWSQGPKRQYCRKKPVTHAPKLVPALHSCADLSKGPCETAPNCYWEPSRTRCVTRAMFQGEERQDMLRQLQSLRTV